MPQTRLPVQITSNQRTKETIENNKQSFSGQFNDNTWPTARSKRLTPI